MHGARQGGSVEKDDVTVTIERAARAFLSLIARFAAPISGLGLLASPQAALAGEIAAGESAPGETAAKETIELDRSDADPALWKLSDEDTTIWLFGTMHALKPDLVWFDDAVSEAFAGSDELVIEMLEPDTATMQKVIGTSGIYTDGSTLSQRLSSEQRTHLAEAGASLGIPMQALDRMKPWFAAVTLSAAPLTQLGYDPKAGAEAVLQGSAREQGKTIAGLESFEEQMGFFSTLPEEQQIAFLMDAASSLAEAGEVYAESERAWGVGDVLATERLINEGLQDTPEVYEVLIRGRNREWADWIQTRMEQPGNVFVAVGAGHLAGTDSVQSVLAERGLTVERVEY